MEPHDLHLPTEIFRAGKAGGTATAPLTGVDIYSVSGRKPLNPITDSGDKANHLLAGYSWKSKVAMPNPDDLEICPAKPGNSNPDKHLTLSRELDISRTKVKGTDFPDGYSLHGFRNVRRNIQKREPFRKLK
jgi:hypothetical protein